VGYSQPQTRLAVVPLPAEINFTNAREVGRDLLAAVMRGVAAVIADLTATTFCDLPGAHMLALVKSQATMRKTRLILVAPSAAVSRALSLSGLDHLLPVYPCLDGALSAESAREAVLPGEQGHRPDRDSRSALPLTP
jgi:anti-sigma B factor antagonist